MIRVGVADVSNGLKTLTNLFDFKDVELRLKGQKKAIQFPKE